MSTFTAASSGGRADGVALRVHLGKTDTEHGPPPRRARFERQFAAVGVDHALRDEQAETVAGAVAPTGAACERLEQSISLVLGYARPVVCHRDRRPAHVERQLDL